MSLYLKIRLEDDKYCVGCLRREQKEKEWTCTEVFLPLSASGERPHWCPLKELDEALYVKSTAEKVYVEHPTWGCLARLCQMSGEFYKADATFERLEYIPQCSFALFQQRVKEFYEVNVEDSHEPFWSKKESVDG